MKVTFNEVQDVLENYKSAVYDTNVERFLAAYAPEMHIYDCWSSFESKGISPMKANVEEWFNGLRADGISLIVDFNDLAVEENLNLAFVYCAVTFAAHDIESGEKLRQITNRFTFGLRKENDSWLIIHQHSSLPIHVETGMGLFDSAKIPS
ncbi:YybH family protein [Paenibacillus hexagrammi]|uniref:Nuclear transport factor 2 family protein n=1 Tax=Paenibacillus hexagrammi TaxID=2908839 RepID=A0ABY3SET6_9BACL|nr:nuclear transport factor 2 family protein [Paenibacillus sp. YPD9-1]UJF32504.1 nuclear transport factor 2 family protein [Paenibacillus sp. YPD9-1]